jgi:hypothetical protein
MLAMSYSSEPKRSSLSPASLMIFFMSQRGNSVECTGTTVVRVVSGFRSIRPISICPRCRELIRGRSGEAPTAYARRSVHDVS